MMLHTNFLLPPSTVTAILLLETVLTAGIMLDLSSLLPLPNFPGVL